MSPSCARRVFGKPGGGGEKRRRREMDFKLVQDFRVAFLLDVRWDFRLFLTVAGGAMKHRKENANKRRGAGVAGISEQVRQPVDKFDIQVRSCKIASKGFVSISAIAGPGSHVLISSSPSS
ncbi:uncharacterized protein TrAFT101_008804 [Trichoderma asperellum]|uniref:uncharacterized protein n=1 Tax=Trichoderma asperellum TaxID=101201 RepID=UPI00331CDDD8|nr:hypothetical protein TrAFT101_008804 [Trichoderma asperellum]